MIGLKDISETKIILGFVVFFIIIIILYQYNKTQTNKDSSESSKKLDEILDTKLEKSQIHNYLFNNTWTFSHMLKSKNRGHKDGERTIIYRFCNASENDVYVTYTIKNPDAAAVVKDCIFQIVDIDINLNYIILELPNGTELEITMVDNDNAKVKTSDVGNTYDMKRIVFDPTKPLP